MASASGTPPVCTKETMNYARLCRLLVEVGSKALRETFDEICPPERLHDILSSHPVRARMESLYNGRRKILHPTQWDKLYPSHPSSVSSREFDITLLMVLLRNISGLEPPNTGWSNPPAATDTSTEADIARVKFYRIAVYAHSSHASIDKLTFGKYWQNIRQTLIRLGGERYGPYIDKLKVDCMDPDIEVHYQELLKQWAEDEDVIEQMEGVFPGSETPPVCNKETSNYARLCRLLVEVGSKALRETFDKLHPPARLTGILSSHPVQASLESLYNGRRKILNPTQWEKLYPSHPSSVSSREFDITLLMLLLRKLPGLNPPANGWSNPPAATDTSIEADIARVKIYGNNVYAHASQASVSDLTFGKYWQDIRQTLIRLGGKRYGSYIDKLKVDCLDPGIEADYQELLKQWAENEGIIDEVEGKEGCLYAQTVDISLLDPAVDVRLHSNHLIAKAVLWSFMRSMKFWRKQKPAVSSRASAYGKEVNPMTEEVACSKSRINRIPPEMHHIDEELRVTKKVMARLEEAINFHQSDHVAEARKTLFRLIPTVSEERFFKTPTKHGLRVLSLGKELFLEEGVSCSVKHGTLLLDSSNSGAQFYITLLNVIGAFAVVLSDVKIAEEIFSLLVGLHEQSDVTSRERDLGAAYNNRGCVSLILGDFKQAERHFKASLKHLDSEKRRRLHSSLLETLFIAVNCNIARLHLLSRNFSEALDKQEKLVKTCKDKELHELPLQLVFTVLNNQAVLCSTLGNFSKAEEELTWLKFYCVNMNMEDVFLINFVSLHLSEVLLLHGKSKEAEKALSIEPLKSADGIELVQMFGGLHINVRIEAFEKLVDVIFLKGKIRFACELLETGVNILKKSFGPDHFNVASLLYKQGTLLTCIGDVSGAAEKFSYSKHILQEIFGVKHPLLLKCYMSLGDTNLRLQRTDDSYLYFQRAMENIEEIYQVSFVSELSSKYMEIIKNSKPFQRSTVREDTGRIEGLVAEHGLAFAVLLSRPAVQDDNSPLRRCKGKQRRTTSDSMEIISLKCTRDFLQCGQTFLHQGMIKEAAAFFQQAGKYCAAYHIENGHPNPCLARLYSILTAKQLGNQETLGDDRDLVNSLEELREVTTKVIKRASEDKEMVISNYELNLKLVLIFLIQLSIELKMIDTTFAAYDLYAKLSPNDEGFLLLLNCGVQVYASRTSITCNGNTAVQDIFVSFTAGLNKEDSRSPISENQLFRNLACKKNVPTDSYLVTYNSSILLDIEDLQVLERQVTLSVQECFQLKCFEGKIKGNTTQVVVDLCSMSTCEYYDILTAGRRIELLSLCLSEETNAKVSHGGNIFEISTSMCQKITQLSFEDEQTCSFIFSKNALSLLQQYNTREILTLSVQSQFLSITITHPVKARLTFWRMDKFIKQKVQLVQAARHDQTGWTVPRKTSCKELVGNCGGADMFVWPAIDHWAKTFHVNFLTVDVANDEPLDVTNLHCKRNGSIFDGRHKKYVQISSDETEQNESLRICLNGSVLEGLTAISDISSLLYGDETQEGDDAIEVVSERTERNRFPSFFQSQLQQEIISSGYQKTTLKVESHNSALEASDSGALQEEPQRLEENSANRSEDDKNELGRSLFEKDRKLRRSFIAEFQESLKKNEGTSKPKFVQADGSSEEVIQKGGDAVIDLKKAETHHIPKSDRSQTSMYITYRTFEQLASNPEAELETQTFYEPLLHGEKTRAAANRGVSHKLNSLGDENSPACENTSGRQDFLEDPNYNESGKDERSSFQEASTQMPQEGDKQNIIESTADNLLPEVEEEDYTLHNLSQSETHFSTHDQTQHRHHSDLQEVHRSRAHTAKYEEMDRASFQIEGVKDLTMPGRYRGQVKGSNEVQIKPLRNKGTDKPVSYAKTTRTSRSSFEADDDIVPDGPADGKYRVIQRNPNDSMPLTDTDVVDRPLERVGGNLQIQPALFFSCSRNGTGMGTLGRSNMGTGTGKSQLFLTPLKERIIRHKFLGFLGNDVHADGDNSNASCDEEDVVDAPVSNNFPKEGGVGIDGGEVFKKSLDINKEISGNVTTSFPLDTARDVIDGPAYSPKIDDNLNNKPLDFGGARPKERSPNAFKRTSLSKTKMAEVIPAPGIHPRFLARHTVKSNGAILEAPLQDGYEEHYFSAKAMAYGEKLRAPWGRFNSSGRAPYGSDLGLDAEKVCSTRPSTRGDVTSLSIYQKHPLNQKESWYLPTPVTNATTAMRSNFDADQECVIPQYSTQMEESIVSRLQAGFSSSWWRSTYNEMDSMTNEYHNSIGDDETVQSPIICAGQQSSTEDSMSSLLGSLQEIMAKTVKLIASRDTVAKQSQQEPKEIEKVGIQEEARGRRDQEQAVTAVVEDSRNQEESSQENEQTVDIERQSIPAPVQETPRPVCSHYQRRCLVRFPCCGKFYPCHRCHNESEDCSDDQARAINATHIRCTICYHEQAIDEQSQHCGGCKSKMSEYFCAICKHFTSVDKNPFHCGKCGICRIHKDRSFHCDVCNVCLDKRLQGKHKCRPDSGHDECCICLEDAFSGCQILPCSHKVHKDCAIAMIQNGVRTCPICRHPLFTQPQNSSQ